jgi:ketosteroid isomerase-like protein
MTNDAWGIALQVMAAFTAYDSDRLLALTHRDFVQESRRVMSESSGASGYDRDAWIAFMEEYHRLGQRVSERPELIATRDDDLCIFRSVTSIDDDEIPYLGVAETLDRRLIRFTSFEPEHFEAAMTALNDRWIDLGGPADKLASFGQIREAVKVGDAAGVRALITDDFVEVDHRPLGMGVRSADEWVTSPPATFDESFTLYLVCSLAEADDVWLGRRYRMYNASAEWPELLVLVQLRAGVLARMEDFPVERLDDAIARFGELEKSEETS